MYKKIIISFFITLLLIVSFVGVIDKNSSTELDKAFTRSFTVFAIARGLNGVISVVQGTEIYATPAGVGVNFAVGQIVDPMNDMVERFSFVMLMSTVSLGVQEIILELSDTNILKFLLLFFGLLSILLLFVEKLRQKNVFDFVLKAFFVLAFLRFLVPILVISNEIVYENMLGPKYEQARSALVFSSTEIKDIVTRVQKNTNEQKNLHVEKNSSDFEKIQNYFSETINSLNVEKQIINLKNNLKNLVDTLDDKFEKAIDYILILITIFIVQSILFPLFGLWVFMKVFKSFIKKELVI